ncbi:MAG TPA: N-acetylmuramic acid 6-phosphate etherase, partial [Hymenobacter sp.]
MSTTESPSLFNNLETLSTRELLTGINSVDQTVPLAVAQALPQIEALVEATVTRLQGGGRLF